jgi:hypothetical protein
MTVKFDFALFDTVYLKTDPEQLERIITGMTYRPGNCQTFCVSQGVNESWHFAGELSLDRDIVKATTN